MPDFDKEGLRNVLLVAVSVCLVCSVIVSSAAVILKPRQLINQELDEKQNILRAAGMLPQGSNQDMQGRGIDEALREACPIRLRPVLMTSLTVILALLPAALGFGAGADTNSPLAVAVIGGMASSTLLTLAVVPAVYSLYENWVANRKSR